ncbi:MAG: 1-(5-phosphoribosyl)-5-[(5-phosphoribosylamino)methylideneamino]imidazole-4-carboxamide isomerase [Oscillospiraceae bacterium]|jgi:phosphoribosylformimino-5-aminoimidazole carboxamide ribotide isomerase|nr:1-(5-phosphoribosyl)-5-[(5-phosphoribosylamino)methylideneamino]imidazole-4-carboxamide isomerase [Oscillospiraceae bacterium]
MKLFPAIDLASGCAVRLLRGDFNKKTVYSDDPASVARGFAAAGAEYLHVVDLQGARDGGAPNFASVARLIAESGLLVEVGGGIRSFDAARRYLDLGAMRVILGTAAAYDRELLLRLLGEYGGKIAVGVDIRDGFVAVKGWLEVSELPAMEFCAQMQDCGVETIICTDISKDGVLGGTNLELYKKLLNALTLDIVASGGVSSLEDVRALRDIGLYGAILGKALYTGALDLTAAVELCRA